MGDKMTMLIGRGVLVGAEATHVGGKITVVGGICPGLAVGMTKRVSGRVVGTPPVGSSVRVACAVVVGADVNASCSSGALVRLQAPVRIAIKISKIATLDFDKLAM
jgi:hypothetical protein